MRRRIMISQIIIAVVAVIAMFIPASIALRHVEDEDQAVELQNEAFLAVQQVESTGHARDLKEHYFAIYGPDGNRIEGDGPAVGDSAVMAALRGKSVVTREDGWLIAAVPLTGGRVLRACEDSGESSTAASSDILRLALVALALILAAALLTMWLSRRVNRPLSALARSAHKLGEGDFETPVATTGLREIDEVAHALNGSAARLKNLLERERHLTTETSHQLRTPLAGLRVTLENELLSPRDDRVALAADLLAAVDRMEQAISDLITLRRESTSNDGRADMNEVVRRSAHRWRLVFAPARRHVAASVDTRPQWTTARPAAIDAVLDVLFDNALRHGVGEVRVTVRDVADSIVVAIADEGRFDTALATDGERPPSSGIGLDLARALATGEGGFVRVARAEPTVVEAWFPAAVAATAG
jgi:signal transduction histidine kinase